MYLLHTLDRNQIEKDSIISQLLTARQLDTVTKCEIWATNFADDGEYCEFKFFNAKSYYPFITKKVEGY